MAIDNSSWQIETLFRKAFARTKERFLSYLIAAVIQYVILAAVFFGLFMLGGFIAVAFGISAKTIGGSGMLIGGGLLAFLVFAGIVVLMYIASWGQLAVATTIISAKKISATDAFKQVKPKIWGMIWVNIASGLFFFGLIPFGLLTFFVLFAVWAVWSSMYVFVYLQQNKAGLDNIWVSKQMVQPRFLGVFGRMAILYGLLYIIVFGLASMNNDMSGFLSMILSLFFGPFAMSYAYEMYTQLSVPKTVVRPTIWIIFSVMGFVLLILGIIFMAGAISQAVQNIMQNPSSAPFRIPSPSPIIYHTF